MATGDATARLARAIKRSNTSTPAWLPRPPQMTLHQGTLTRVDTFNGVADFQFPDPSGLLLPSVRFWQAYSDAHLPEVGDVAWGLHVGTDFLVIGQHLVQTGTVTVT